MKKYNFDVAVVGGGPAGLAAAVEAAEKGAKTGLFEKSTKVGGARDGGIGFLGVESEIQKAEGSYITKKDAFNYMMEHASWKTNARLVSEYINMSASTVEWMQKLGLKLTHSSSYYPGAASTIHNYADFRNVKITNILLQKAIELGVEICYESAILHAVMADGKVVGFRGTTRDGEPIEGICTALIVAGGGFGGDPELVSETGYTVDKDLMYTFDMPNMNGDGLRLMWEAGATKAPMMMDTYLGLAKGYGGPMGTAPKLAGLRQPTNIMVNQKGYRFMPEDLVSNPAYVGSAIHSQYGHCGIMILDEKMYQKFMQDGGGDNGPGPGGPPAGSENKREPHSEAPQADKEVEPFERFTGTMDEIMREAIAQGSEDFFIAESLEDLAEQADIPFDNLKNTIDEYNGMCQQKEDYIFYKAPRYLQPICGPKYYAARFFCDTYGGLGGVKIDHRARVLNKQEDPIPGLYAAGNDANTIFGECYPFYMAGNTSGFALNTGRMAGMASAEFCGYK